MKGIASGGQTPTDGAAANLGEDIMIFPGDKEVTFYVSLVPTDKESDSNLSEITLDPMKVVLNAGKITGDPDATFEAGKKYSVLLTVYGLEQVQVSASLREWDEVDEWTFDPDDEYADQVTVTSITAVNTSTNTDVTLYHTAKVFKDGVSVYTDKELTTPAEDGNYSTKIESTSHTFSVEDGKVTKFN